MWGTLPNGNCGGHRNTGAGRAMGAAVMLQKGCKGARETATAREAPAGVDKSREDMAAAKN